MSGTPVRRPNGQRKPADEAAPSFGPCRNLDYELELGVWIGPGNALGDADPDRRGGDHIAGFCLLNDWSARDIQAWEYQPLGPFLGKNFCTHHFAVGRHARGAGAVPRGAAAAARRRPGAAALSLGRRRTRQSGALDIELEVLLLTAGMRDEGPAAAPAVGQQRAATSTGRWRRWSRTTPATAATCGPATCSAPARSPGPSADELGSLLEISGRRPQPIDLPTGETRRFLEDGDEVILRAHCRRDGYAPIGFGECRGTIVAPGA